MPTGVYKRKGNELEKANKQLHYVFGTKIEALMQRVSKNNKSTKIKGISCYYHKLLKKKVYKATIQLAKKRYYKLCYTLEEAIKWRREKEKELYKPLLEILDKVGEDNE